MTGGGVLQQLTTRPLESALEGEITDRLGYDKHDPAGAINALPVTAPRVKTVLSADDVFVSAAL